MRRLARRRSLVILVALAVGLTAFGLPGDHGGWDDCSGLADQHCSPVALSPLRLPVPAPLGLVEAHHSPSSPSGVFTPILKVPLAA